MHRVVAEIGYRRDPDIKSCVGKLSMSFRVEMVRFEVSISSSVVVSISSFVVVGAQYMRKQRLCSAKNMTQQQHCGGVNASGGVQSERDRCVKGAV
jgi:hypothetical protein